MPHPVHHAAPHTRLPAVHPAATGRLAAETSCEAPVRWLGRAVVDGRPGLVGEQDGAGIRFHDPATGDWRPTGADRGDRTLMLHGRPLVVEADKGGTVWVGDLLTGETRCVLRGHTGYWIAGIVVVEPAGRPLLATAGGADRTARLWDPATGECVLTIPVRHQVLGCAGVGPDLLAVAVPSGVLTYRIQV